MSEKDSTAPAAAPAAASEKVVRRASNIDGRILDLVSVAADKAEGYNPKVAAALRAMSPAIEMAVKGINIVGPYYLIAYRKIYDLYLMAAPHADIMDAVTGFGLCFAGGNYCTLIAAYEAFRLCGWDNTQKCIGIIMEDFEKIKEANEKDNMRDDDNDGIADVDQISGKDLASRKIKMAAIAVKDPQRLNEAMVGVYTAWLGVVATLKLQFARTIAIGVNIGSMLKMPVSRVAAPALAQALDKEYHRYIPLIISYTIHTVAITIAWWIQRVISAFFSGLKGGLLCARGLMNFTRRMGLHKLDDDDTYADEILGFVLCALGVYWQLSNGFSEPFPLNILMLPFSFGESFIQYYISIA